MLRKRGESVKWPARSPHLNLLDFCASPHKTVNGNIIHFKKGLRRTDDIFLYVRLTVNGRISRFLFFK